MQLVLCTEYRVPNLIVVSVSPCGAELDASDRILEAVKCTKVMDSRISTTIEYVSFIYMNCSSTTTSRLHVVREEHATSTSCMQSNMSVQRNGAMKPHVYLTRHPS